MGSGHRVTHGTLTAAAVRAATALLAALTLLTVLAPAAGAATARPAAASTRGAISEGNARGAASAATSAVCKSAAHPELARRMSRGIVAALHRRHSVVGLTVDDPAAGLTCALDQSRHFVSASVVKATILAALLRKLMQKHRYLSKSQEALATKMITVSDNNAASALWAQTGRYWLQHFLDLAKMKHTELGHGGTWGLTQLTAHDEMLLLKVLTAKNSVLDTPSRDYELSLMHRVIPSERWGVTAGAPADLTAHVKNGWLPYPVSDDWRINSIGSFSGHHRDYMIAVLTTGNKTMTYGVDTIQDVAEVINRDLNEGVTNVVPASAPYPSWGTPDEPLSELPHRS